MFLLLDCYYLQFLPLPSVPCPKPSTHTPPFHPELWASPWEVIYNAIGVTIIRLHTISLCPLCLGRLLWATFLFAQKHIVRPSSENTRKHLAQTGTGRLPMSKISDTPSSVTISGVFVFFFQLSDFTIFKVTRKTQKGNGGEWGRLQPLTPFLFIVQWTIMFRFCCHVGIIPHEIQTRFLTALHGFFFFPPQADWHLLTTWGSLVTGITYCMRLIFISKGM